MSIVRKMHLLMIACLLSFNAFSKDEVPTLEITEESLSNRWSVLIGLGYTDYKLSHSTDSQSPFGRLALGAELMAMGQANFGLEVGFQNGHHMYLEIPQTSPYFFGSTISTTIRPMVDLLLTATANPVNESLFFTLVKGGIAYRQWQISSAYINNKSEISGEVQAGFGYPLTELSNLNLVYQGIFGSNPKIYVNYYPYSGHVANLPVQHGVLLGLSIII